MPLETWLLFLLIAIFPAMSPGPAIFLALSNTLRFGYRLTLWSATANAIGLFLLGLAIAFGLGAVMEASAAAFTVLKLVGAGYLVWLGIRTWRARGAFVAKGENVPRPRRRQVFSVAFLVAVTNPKAMVLIAAIIPPFLDPLGDLPVQALILSATYGALCFLCHLVIALAATRARGFFDDEKSVTHLRRGLGAVFIGFGALLATTQR